MEPRVARVDRREARRVLEHGSRWQIADIVGGKAVPDEAKQDIAHWTGWIAAALSEAMLRPVINAAGFVAVEFSVHRFGTFRTRLLPAVPPSSASSGGRLRVTARPARLMR